MPKTPFPPPTEEQKRAAFQNSMHYEIIYTFGVPRDYNEFDYFQWEVVNFCRMTHARLLHTFFETPLEERYKDDVLAADYGFTPREILSRDERDRLNKDLLHFSYGRLRHSPESKRWPDSILASLLAPTLEFMELVKARHDLLPTSEEMAAWRAIIEWLKGGYELRVWSDAPDGRPRYHARKGRALPDGKPALTIWRSGKSWPAPGRNTAVTITPANTTNTTAVSTMLAGDEVIWDV